MTETIAWYSSNQEPSRATSSELKREVIERLLKAWEKAPQLRLGQLITNCFDEDFFYLEDFPFVATIEKEVRVWTSEVQ